MGKSGNILLSAGLVWLLLSGCEIGKTPEINSDENKLVISNKDGILRIELWNANTIRVVRVTGKEIKIRKSLMVLDPVKKFTDWEYTKEGDLLTIQTKTLILKLDLKSGKIAFFNRDGNEILQESGYQLIPAKVEGEDQARHVEQDFLLSDGEAIYGLGQHQDGIMNCRNHDVTLVQENRIAVVPVVVSTKNYGILWDNYSKTKFHDGRGGMRLWSEVGDGIDYYFFAGSNMDEVIAGYRRLTGKAPMFAKWAYGYWQSKERYKTQDEIVNTVREYRKRRVPLDMIVQDWQYWGKSGWNAIEFDRSVFPDPAKMLEDIHDMHTHYAISIWPVFDSITAVYKDMYSHGFIVNSKSGGNGRLYDAYNPEARKLFWKWLNKNLFSIGVDAWWMDATEPEFAGNSPEERAEEAKKLKDNYLGTWARYLNSYSLMSTKGVYENQRKTTDRKRVCILTRSAFGGQQRYASITWSGDIKATWEIFRNQIPAGLNFIFTGIPYWTTDIGAFIPNNPLGCKDEAYREIYVRWYQFGTFCPIFRSHGTGTPREVWQFGDKGYWSYESLVKFDRLRYRLLPYIYSLAGAVTQNDYTIMRGLVFDFNNDTRTYDIDNEYMFGPAFLVTPVTEKMYFDHTYIGKVIPPRLLYDENGKPGGITAEFYNGQHFDTLVTTRIEKDLDFDWNDGKSRPEGIHQHYYSIRFSGEILAEQSGEYSFVTTSNDGIRVWVDNRLIIDNWTDHGVTVNMGKIMLEKGMRYSIKMEYYQTLGVAITKLAWITPVEAKTLGTQKLPKPKSYPVYLPKGVRWYNFWTGELFDGGQTVCTPAPIDQMPLYIKAGSVLPMGPDLQYTGEIIQDPVEIRIYPGRDGDFTLYEDENDNYNYEKNAFSTITFLWDDSNERLTIKEREGQFDGMLQKRTFNIVISGRSLKGGFERPRSLDHTVVYNGKETMIDLSE